jgi:hypothetical protein
LIAIVLRKMRAQAGDSRLTLKKVFVGWGRTVVRRGHHRKEKNAKGWSLRVEDERSEDLYLYAGWNRGILDLSLYRARVGRYGNCSHDNQGIVQMIWWQVIILAHDILIPKAAVLLC